MTRQRCKVKNFKNPMDRQIEKNLKLQQQQLQQQQQQQQQQQKQDADNLSVPLSTDKNSVDNIKGGRKIQQQNVQPIQSNGGVSSDGSTGYSVVDQLIQPSQLVNSSIIGNLPNTTSVPAAASTSPPQQQQQIPTSSTTPTTTIGISPQQPKNVDLVSIENAFKSEIAQIPMKTPVSILQELLSRRGITPSYELVQIEGAIHEPTFRYRVSFNDKDAMGAGKSKKEAKHAAAKMLIDKLTGTNFDIQQQQQHLQLNWPTAVPTGGVVTLPTRNGLNGIGGGAGNNLDGIGGVGDSIDPDNSYDDKVSGNPIGWLQELCMYKRWPPPTYDTEMEVGLPHQRQFTIACVVLKYQELGQGKSKKIAKRLAAHKMWLRLQDNPLDQNQISSHIDDLNTNVEENRVTNVLNRYADLKDVHIPTLTNQHSFKVSQFHKTLKATFGTQLNVLQTTCLNDVDVNYVQFLHEIALEHQFEVTYVDVEEKTYTGRNQCLVQLSTLPVAVCHGSGTSSKEAQSSAAHNALEYLKIMTKM